MPDATDPAAPIDAVEDPDRPLPDPVELDDATVATLLAARITDHLGVEVEVHPIIGERFSVVGSGPELLTDVPGIAAAEEAVLGMIFADAPSLRFHDQWALHNTVQDSGAGSGIPGVDIDWDPAADHGGHGVLVAVIDTPFDTSHPALVERWWHATTAQDCDPRADPDEPVEEC